MTYKIMYKYKGITEEIDTANSKQEAQYLLGEYRLAYGPGCKIWIAKVRKE